MSWELSTPILVRMLVNTGAPHRTTQKRYLIRHYSVFDLAFIDDVTYNELATKEFLARDTNKLSAMHPNTYFKKHAHANMFTKEDLSLTPEVDKYVLASGDRIYRWTQTYRCTECGVLSLKLIDSHVNSRSCSERKMRSDIEKSDKWVEFSYTFKNENGKSEELVAADPYAYEDERDEDRWGHTVSFRENDWILYNFFPNNYINKYEDVVAFSDVIYAKKELFEACKTYALNKIKSKGDNEWVVWSQNFTKEVLFDRDEYLTNLGFKLKFKIAKAIDLDACQCGARLEDSKWAYSDGTTTIRLCKTHGQALAVCFDEVMSKM